MMVDELFVIGFGTFLAILLTWSFKTLTKENWQIMGAVPVKKNPQGGWTGINLTYYGFFNASACTLATAIFLILMGTLQIPFKAVLAFLTVLMAVCMPAARFVAFLVEKKRYTFSIGGASFVGLMVTPWIVVSMQRFLGHWLNGGFQVTTVLSTLLIAYAFGEGVGRLACISFGCCYGKPLSNVHPAFQYLFKHLHFVFSGKTRKIVYADGFSGVKVVPIQALTAILYCGVGLVGLYLFLKSYFSAAVIITLLVTQSWRFVSEFLRADYRGGGRISAYQVMACLALIYGLAAIILLPVTVTPAPVIAMGVKSVWQPIGVILLQILWLTVFIYTGKSQVTASQIYFHVVEEHI